jgi:hypothetical protein
MGWFDYRRGYRSTTAGLDGTYIEGGSARISEKVVRDVDVCGSTGRWR